MPLGDLHVALGEKLRRGADEGPPTLVELRALVEEAEGYENELGLLAVGAAERFLELAVEADRIEVEPPARQVEAVLGSTAGARRS